MKGDLIPSMGLLAVIAGGLVGCGAPGVTPSMDASAIDVVTATDTVTVADSVVVADTITAIDVVAATDASPDPWTDAATRPDGRVVRGPYATRIVSFTPGAEATFGQAYLPDVVLGPPVGAGDQRGGTDVVSLGLGGTIVLGFERDIVDGPGDDFIVFENAFNVLGVEGRVWEELGEVSVSDDGERWVTFPCAPMGPRPHTGCAGWNPVYSSPTNGLSPLDPRASGGDVFDLATIRVASARFIRIRDLATQGPMPPSSGFDLDAVGVIHSR